MALDEQGFRKLKQEVEQARSDADRAQGTLDGLMAQLKEEFECETVEAAQQKLKKLQKKATDAETEFDEALAAYQKKWKGEE